MVSDGVHCPREQQGWCLLQFGDSGGSLFCRLGPAADPGPGEAGCGLRNRAVKGIKWSSLHHKSLLESFGFPALVSACVDREALCTFKGVASAGVSYSDGLG